MRTVDDIIKEWKIARGVLTQGKSREYFKMDWKNALEHYSALIETFLHEGYAKEHLLNKPGHEYYANSIIRAKIVNAMVYSGDGTKLKGKRLKDIQDEQAEQWETALRMKFPGKTCEPTITKELQKSTKKVEKPRPIIDEDAKNTIVMDTSDMAPVPFDEEFLAKIAAQDAQDALMDGNNE